jgi:hypothetical protein
MVVLSKTAGSADSGLYLRLLVGQETQKHSRRITSAEVASGER